MKKYLALLIVTTHCIQSQDTENMHRYIWANYNQFAGRKKIAHEWYKEILHNSPSMYAYKGYAHLLFDAGQFQAMLPLLTKLEPLCSSDPILGLIFAQALEQTGNLQLADERIIALNEKFKNNQEIAYQTVNTYVRRKEPENALKIIDNFLNSSPRKPTHFVFYFLKSQIYAKLNNFPDALTNIQKSLELQPYFDRGWLMLALLQENAGRIKEAIQGYNTFLEIVGPQAEVESHLVQLMFKQKMAQTHTHSSIKTDNLEKALNHFEKKEYETALKLINSHLHHEPEDVPARLLKIQILTALKKFDQTVETLKGWIIHNPQDLQWFQVLSLLPKSGAHHQTVITALQKIHEKFPKNSHAILYLAQAHIKSKDFNKAVPILEKALNIADNNNLKTRIYFQIGMIHYHLKDYNAMHTALEQGRALHTDFPPLLNLLAYYYATKGNNLAEAQKLMKIVLGYDPHNPHFRDTQAMIFYKQKKYGKALKMLEQIAQAHQNDFTIQKHLGKTYNKLAKKQQAAQSFKKAITIAANDCDKQYCEKLLKKYGYE